MIMEAKFNIAEILKDKPQGTKLYDWLYNRDVELDTISTTDTETVVWCTKETDNNTTYYRGYSEFGTVRGCPDGLQILLPSKEMRDWRKFDWKKGDVLVSNDSDSHIIFKGFSKDDYTTFEGKHWISVSKKRHISCLDTQNTQNYHIEDNKEVAQTYIKTIEKKLDGKLNLETLEVEKQTEFKDGDIVVYGKSVAICRKIYKHTLYFYVSIDETFGLLFNDNCVSAEGYRFATDSEKQQLFEALAKGGKAWDAEKKEVVDLKPKWTPKPFDKIVAFEEMSKEWVCDMFSHYSKNYEDKEVIVTLGGCTYFKALPFNEETAKLIGTTDNWEGNNN